MVTIQHQDCVKLRPKLEFVCAFFDREILFFLFLRIHTLVCLFVHGVDLDVRACAFGTSNFIKSATSIGCLV